MHCITHMLQTLGAIFVPFAVLAIQANFYPSPYARCMETARQRQGLTLEARYSTGQWQLDDAYCALQQ